MTRCKPHDVRIGEQWDLVGLADARWQPRLFCAASLLCAACGSSGPNDADQGSATGAGGTHAAISSLSSASGGITSSSLVMGRGGTVGSSATASTGAATAGGTLAEDGNSSNGGRTSGGANSSTGGKVVAGGGAVTRGATAAGGHIVAGGTTIGAGGSGKAGNAGFGGSTAVGNGGAGGVSTTNTAITTGQAAYFVSPEGSDSNPGSLRAPFQTLGKARDAVRTISAKMTDDIYVYLRGGTYSITSTLAFASQDSGTNGHRIYYAAYPGETPVLSGATKVSGWTLASGSVYKATLNRSTKLRNLYVNDKRASMTSKTVTSKGATGTYSVTAGQATWAWANGSGSDGVNVRGIPPATTGPTYGLHNDEGSAYITENDNVLDIAPGVKYTINSEEYGNKHDLTILRTYATVNKMGATPPNSTIDPPVAVADNVWPVTQYGYCLNAGVEEPYRSIIPSSLISTQDYVFPASCAVSKGTSALNIRSSGNATNAVWLAPAGTTTFAEGSTMTRAMGTATSIAVPTNTGIYKLFVVDSRGKMLGESASLLRVQ